MMPMILVHHKYPLKSNLKRRKGRVGAYLALSHLTGRNYLPADLAAIIAKYRQSDVIRWVTAVSSWISVDNGMDIRRQAQMAEVVLPDDLLQQTVNMINQKGDEICLFYRRQLLFVLQLALIVCKEPPPKLTRSKCVLPSARAY